MASSQEPEQRQLLTSESSSSDPQSERRSQPASFQQFQERSSAVRHRPTYARVPSVSFANELDGEQVESHDREDVQKPGHTAVGKGLGISMSQPLGRVQPIITQPIRAHDTAGDATTMAEQSTCGPIRPVTSSPAAGGMSGSTKYDSPQSELDSPDAVGKNPAKQSHASFQSSSQPSVSASSEAGLLSARSKDHTFDPEHECRSKKEIRQTRLSLVSITILLLAVYGTVMSTVFLVIAMVGPHYRHYIGTDNGWVTISQASVITTFFAKTIELSFVTIMVALLGQALVRRAHNKKKLKGITLAELGMRSWILQPGTLITHWESVWYAGFTALGITSLLATLLATLYVTAANAVVQPQLRFLGERPKPMQGIVKTIFANTHYQEQQCKTPIDWKTTDAHFGGTTCLQVQHAAAAYHNYYAYLSIWDTLSTSGNGVGDLQYRPNAFAIINDNTTINGSWIDWQYNNMTELNNTYGRFIMNVSMAMPHAGVPGAATDSVNEIMQPQELDGLGMYRIHASVPSPAVHVLCAMLSTADLDPYYLHQTPVTNVTYIPSSYTLEDPDPDSTSGNLSLHKLFRWGEAYGSSKWPPIFKKLPPEHNTIVNDSLIIESNETIPYGRDSIYLLGNATITGDIGVFNYPLCQIKASQTPRCSTWYNASSSGATMASVCEDPNDKWAYFHSNPDAVDGNASLTNDWPYIAGEWIKSLGLNSGNADTNGSNSRALLQLMPKKFWNGTISLDPSLPSIAEALAVMAGSALLSSSRDAPFVPFWNYTAPNNILDPGTYQYFNASIEPQEYASGVTNNYQYVWVVILFAVALLDLFALVYFVAHRGWYEDLSEPSNLFCLAINSPPSKELAGSCVRGPQGKQFCSSWKLHEGEGHISIESVEVPPVDDTAAVPRRRRFREGFDIMMTPVRRARESFSERRAH